MLEVSRIMFSSTQESAGQEIPHVSMVRNLPADAGDVGSTPGSGRSISGGNGTPLQYPCLENSTERGLWGWATVHRVSKSQA